MATQTVSEIWRPVVGHENFYSVSNLGRVRRDVGGSNSTYPGRMMTRWKDPSGYARVMLRGGPVQVSRLVAIAFLQNPQSKPCVNHLDGNRFNDRMDNLEWVTHKENNLHSRDRVKAGRWRDIAEIRSLAIVGDVSQSAIAKRFGVDQSLVSRIKNGHAWNPSRYTGVFA